MAPAEINFDITRLTDRQRRALFARLRIVEAWERQSSDARARGTTKRQLAGPFVRRLRRRGAHVCLRTLQIWRREYLAVGLIGLVDQRWISGVRHRFERHLKIAPFLRELTRRYTGPGLLSVNTCHSLTTEWADNNGHASATLRESWRFLKLNILPKLTKEPGTVLRPRKRP